MTCGINKCRQKEKGYLKDEFFKQILPICNIHLTYMQIADKSPKDMAWKPKYDRIPRSPALQTN